VDLQSPYVVAVYPAPGATYVPRAAGVTVQFSKWIDRGTNLGQVLLSPPIPGRLKVKVDEDRLVIRLPKAAGGLKPKTTYRVSILGSVKDLHGNAMGNAFSLAFTTGAGFDSGTVSGHVDAPDRKGTILVALYRVSGRDSNSVLPRLLSQEPGFHPDSLPSVGSELPAFLISADSMGAFAFDSVTQGRYAVLAFEDVNGNLAPDFGFEPIGIGSADLPLTPRTPKQFLHLASLDTGFLRVSSVRFVADSTDSTAKDSLQGILRVKFTYPPRLDSAADIRRYHLMALAGTDTSKSKPKESDAGPKDSSKAEVKAEMKAPIKTEGIPLTAIGWDPESGEWVLETPVLQRDARYRLEVQGLLDTVYGTREFTASISPPDSEPWTASFLAPPDASGLLTLSSGDLLSAKDFQLLSSRALNATRWRALQERLEARVDTEAVKMELALSSPVQFSVRLSAPLPSGQNFELRLKHARPDSTFQTLASAHVVDSLKLGGLRFHVPAVWKGWTFLLQARSIAATEWAVKPVADTVSLAPLVAGRYRLSAFFDSDGDGAWTPGSLRPWTPQEPYAVLLDSLDVPAADTVTDVTSLLPADTVFSRAR